MLRHVYVSLSVYLSLPATWHIIWEGSATSLWENSGKDPIFQCCETQKGHKVKTIPMHSHSKEDASYQHSKGPSFCGPNAQTSSASDPLVSVIERKARIKTIVSKKSWKITIYFPMVIFSCSHSTFQVPPWTLIWTTQFHVESAF